MSHDRGTDAASGPAVSLFVTCLADHFQASAAEDAVWLLRSLGCTVRVPPRQTCCGQPAFNVGHTAAATRMARHTVGALEESGPVVLPSGSCAAMIRHRYADVLPERAGAIELCHRTFELSEYIVGELGITHLGNGLTGRRVALHVGCHALRDGDGGRAARTLLRNAGARLATWEAQDECCGFGGLFATKMEAVSLAMADRKLDTLGDIDCLTSPDPGCLLHLAGRATRRRLPVRAVPLATLLREAAD